MTVTMSHRDGYALGSAKDMRLTWLVWRIPVGIREHALGREYDRARSTPDSGGGACRAAGASGSRRRVRVSAADAGTQLAGRSLFLAVKAVPLSSASMGSVAAPRATASGPRRPSSIEVWASG